eukprot:5896690-Pleurochrysis_carterae.AAC.1
MTVVGFDPLFPAEMARKLNIEPVTAAEAMRRADFLTVRARTPARTRTFPKPHSFDPNYVPSSPQILSHTLTPNSLS